MEIGNETWKWALVLVLLSVFVLVANHAYKALNNPEDQLPPPDDWKKGDSFDQEHGAAPGPGAGQPVEVPATISMPITPVPTPGEVASAAPVQHEGEMDWNKVKDPGGK